MVINISILEECFLSCNSWEKMKESTMIERYLGYMPGLSFFYKESKRIILAVMVPAYNLSA